jgi:hypothetical protein
MCIYIYIFTYRRDDKIRSSMDMLQKRQKINSIEMGLESLDESGPIKNKVYKTYMYMIVYVYIYVNTYVFRCVFIYGYMVVFVWK